MTIVPFDQLWEQAEQLHSKSINEDQVPAILDELMLKINIYRAIAEKKEIPQQEHQQMKARTMGEILLTMTKLSLKDNINVYRELDAAIKAR